MATLPKYESIAEKNQHFRISQTFPENKIDSIDQFDDWYEKWKRLNVENTLGTFFFRGLNEACYKLYTSAQRFWIENELKKTRKNLTYRQFFKNLLKIAQGNPILKSVLEFYNLDGEEPTVPLMSLLQHYRGITPFLDWSYDIDVALYFATEETNKNKKIIGNDIPGEIDNYCSVCIIDNRELQIKSMDSKKYPSFHKWLEDQRPRNSQVDRKSYLRLIYLTDFEENASISRYTKNARNSLTSIYNQNIIPQRGLFIANPSRETPLEEFEFAGGKENISKIQCYHLHKELAEHIHKKIGSNRINKQFIYPNLSILFKKLKNNKDLFKNKK